MITLPKPAIGPSEAVVVTADATSSDSPPPPLEHPVIRIVIATAAANTLFIIDLTPCVLVRAVRAARE